jgi:hypothetical protein
MPARSLLATAAVGLVACGGLVAADAASATLLLQTSATGFDQVVINKIVTVPGWKIRRAKRVIAVMVGRTTELDPTGVRVDGVPSEMEGIVKVVCTGFRGGTAQRTIHFAAEGDGQNASIIRLPGYTGYGCAFRFAVLAQWFPSANTLVNQFAAVRIETY